MFMYDDYLFSIYFGDRYQKVEPQRCKSLTATSLFAHDPFSLLQKRMNISALLFLHQVHKASGKVISDRKDKDSLLFFEEGDYLVTNQSSFGLGIVTADCLPIVYVDTVKKVVGVAHAGWRGSVAGIAKTVIKDMQNHYNSEIKDIIIFFGPSAKKCCYQVDEPFVRKIGSGSSVKKALFKKGGQYYFDLALYNAEQLIEQGFTSQQLIFDYNECTICHDNFCSYRRQEGSSARQVTVVSLK